MRIIGAFLILSLFITPSFAVTEEVSSKLRDPGFWQEADITFWQTLPFATLWGHFIERQFSAIMFPGAAAHWNAIAAFATVVSAGNALIHAQRVTQKNKTD